VSWFRWELECLLESQVHSFDLYLSQNLVVDLEAEFGCVDGLLNLVAL
jgi:hypothetical protein